MKGKKRGQIQRASQARSGNSHSHLGNRFFVYTHSQCIRIAYLNHSAELTHKFPLRFNKLAHHTSAKKQTSLSSVYSLELLSNSSNNDTRSTNSQRLLSLMKRFSFFASLGFGSFFFRILTRGFDNEDPWYPAHLASARYTNHEAFGSCVVQNLKKVSFIHGNFTRPLCFVVGD